MKPLTKEEADVFVGFLERQYGPEGRANLAELRRAAADPLRDFRDIRILGDHLPNTDRPTAEDDWLFDVHRLTAALFALYATKFWGKNDRLDLPRFASNEKRRSLGASLRRMRNQLSGGQDSLDMRFSALLDTHRDDLPVPMRSMIQRIATATERIPIDFSRLLRDIVNWNDDGTARTWARDYWQSSIAKENDPIENESEN